MVLSWILIHPLIQASLAVIDAPFPDPSIDRVSVLILTSLNSESPVEPIWLIQKMLDPGCKTVGCCSFSQSQVYSVLEFLFE